MTLAITILGCGSSGGVPRVAYGWGACDPGDPRNRRRRCSILVERRSPEGLTRVLVDTSPDLREQLLDAGVDHLDGVLYTHEHADHTHGIDDLRALVIHMRRRMTIFADLHTGELLRQRFRYCFETPVGSDYPPILEERRIQDGLPVEVHGAGGAILALPIRVQHGQTEALGFRFDDMAYMPDVSHVPAEGVEALMGLDLLIIDALRPTRHPSHFSVSDALGLIERTRPRRAVLTNLHTDLDYATLAASLPPHIVPAHDGLRIEAGHR